MQTSATAPRPDQTQEPGHDVRHYLAILKTRKWTIVVVTLLCVIGALVLSSRQTPLYTAETRLLVRSDLGIPPNPENEAAIISSAPVATRVIEDLELDQTADSVLGSLEATPISPTSDVIAIRYTSDDAQRSRDVANFFARNYIEYKVDKAREGTEEQQQQIEDRIGNVDEQLDKITASIREARQDNDEARVATLESQRSIISARLGILLNELDDLQVDPTGGTGVGEILEPAVAPSNPSSPDHTRNGTLGLLAGLLLGVGVAFLRERMDDRFRGRPDIERALEVPVLGTVPKFTKGAADLPVLGDPRGPASESYRNLRTGIQFLISQSNLRSLLITSASAHEGKTSTTANLGIALSQTGHRVVLISADLRRPQLEKALGAQTGDGLSNWLLGEVADPHSIMLEHPAIPNLSLVPAGRIPSNPAELLTSPKLPELLHELQRSFDLVILDSPPALPVADAVILASHVDAVVLVVNAANTARSAAVHAKQQVERVGGNLIGCVLNAFDPSDTPYYYEPYYYSNYYTSETDDGSSNGDRRERAVVLGKIAGGRSGER